MRTYTKSALSSMIALGLLGCGGGGGGGDGDPDATPAQTVSIQEVQDDAMAAGTSIRVEDVVVTAVDTFGSRSGAIWVQEPEGGARSGVVVNTSAVPSDVEVGSVVTVTGFKDEFSLDSDPLTVTQINSPTVTVTGSGTVPAPEVLDPRTLVDPNVAEDWEGVLIEFHNVRFEGLPGGAIGEDDTFREARLTGPFRIQSALTAFPDPLAYRDCYASIVGVGDYFFDYKIQPRSATDYTVSADDGACPAEETICDNSTDDDADGFADCQDFACFAADLDTASNTCAADAKLQEVQDDTEPVDKTVEVVGTITAIGRDGDELWLQTEASEATCAAANQNNGLHVELFRSVLPEGGISGTYNIGNVVGVVGIIRNSFGETVLSQADIAMVDNETPTACTDAVVADITGLTSGKIYEASLISLSDVPITDASKFSQYGTIVLEGGLVVEDTLFSYKAEPSLSGVANGQCLTVTGIVLLNTFDDFYFLAPRQLADISVAGCP